MRATYNRGLEVVDDFDDSLPLLDLDVVDGGNRGSDDTLEGGQAREEGNGDSRESHLGRTLILNLVWWLTGVSGGSWFGDNEHFNNSEIDPVLIPL
jgi:hypothetical protein